MAWALNVIINKNSFIIKEQKMPQRVPNFANCIRRLQNCGSYKEEIIYSLYVLQQVAKYSSNKYDLYRTFFEEYNVTKNIEDFRQRWSDLENNLDED